jgi:glycosyltransferase involved in cell wall biosynthesis
VSERAHNAHPAPDAPGVAVIVPAFNRARTIGRTLDAVAAQTRAPRRLVVVDDGSEDDLAGAFEAWRDRARPAFPSELVRQPNAGAAAARNHGLALVGDAPLVAFLDSDDAWPPDLLERAEAALAHRPDAVAASADQLLEDPGGARGEPRSLRDLPANPVRWMVERDAGIGSCTVARTPAVRELGGYDEAFPTGHDALLFLRMATLGAWTHAPGAPVRMGRGAGRASGDDDHLHRSLANPEHVWAEAYERFLAEEGGRAWMPHRRAAELLAARWRRAADRWWTHLEGAAARACERQSRAYDHAADADAWPEPLDPARFDALATSASTHPGAEGGAHPPRATIAIEWESGALARQRLSRRLLEGLDAQGRSWIEHHDRRHHASPNPRARITEPVGATLEILVVFDSRRIDGRRVHRLVSGVLPFDSPLVVVRLIGAPRTSYSERKRLGVASASGDLVVLIDSDLAPEPGWLGRLVEPLERAGVNAVAGATAVDPGGLVGRTFALLWRPDPAPSPNHLALRRSAFATPPVAAADDRGPAPLPDGAPFEGIVREVGASMLRRPPADPLNFLLRALAEGRDRALIPGKGSAGASRATLAGLVRERRSVGLRAIEVPPALAIAAAYYALRGLGGFLARAAPGATRRWLRV